MAERRLMWVSTFEKETNLLDYFYSTARGEKFKRLSERTSVSKEEQKWYCCALNEKDEYAQKRKVKLIIYTYMEDGKYISRIKCPISPIPIRGEFQMASWEGMKAFLENAGWTYVETLRGGLLK